MEVLARGNTREHRKEYCFDCGYELAASADNQIFTCFNCGRTWKRMVYDSPILETQPYPEWAKIAYLNTKFCDGNGLSK